MVKMAACGVNIKLCHLFDPTDKMMKADSESPGQSVKIRDLHRLTRAEPSSDS